MFALLLLQAITGPVRADVAKAVAIGFRRFDGDGRIMAAMIPEAAADAAAEPRWTARAFEQADVDRSGALSRTELMAFLTDKVGWRLPRADDGVYPGAVRSGPMSALR